LTGYKASSGPPSQRPGRNVSSIWVPLESLVEDPDVLALGEIASAVFVDQIDTGGAGTDTICAREEALCLFQNYGRVGQSVEEMRLFGEQLGETGEIGAADGFVLGADTCQRVRIGG
jgi:hypothetical protein